MKQQFSNAVLALWMTGIAIVAGAAGDASAGETTHYYIASTPEAPRPQNAVILEWPADTVAAVVTLTSQVGIDKKKQLIPYLLALKKECDSGSLHCVLVSKETGLPIEGEADVSLDDPPRVFKVVCIAPISGGKPIPVTFGEIIDAIKRVTPNGLTVTTSQRPVLVLTNADKEPRARLIKMIVDDIKSVVSSLDGSRAELSGLDGDVKVVQASHTSVYVVLDYKAKVIAGPK